MMADTQVQITAAARTLVQWGRKRQAHWRDASSDLFAALGNRYAAFEALTPEPRPIDALLEPAADAPPAPSPWDALATLPETTPVPAYAQLYADVPPYEPAPAPVVSAPPPFAAAMPVAPPSPVPVPSQVPPSPAPATVPASAVARTATTAPEKTEKASSSAKKTSGRAQARAARGRHFTFGRVALAAVVIVAAVASPTVWRTYNEPPAPVAPATSEVTIDSYPAGSQVLIDGVDVGKTPFTTTLIVGKHAVELRYRKNVRKLDLDVIAGMPASARVDWVKKPAPRKRAAPTKAAASATTATSSAAVPAPASTPQVDAPIAPAVPAETPDSSPLSSADAR